MAHQRKKRTGRKIRRRRTAHRRRGHANVETKGAPRTFGHAFFFQSMGQPLSRAYWTHAGSAPAASRRAHVAVPQGQRCSCAQRDTPRGPSWRPRRGMRRRPNDAESIWRVAPGRRRGPLMPPSGRPRHRHPSCLQARRRSCTACAPRRAGRARSDSTASTRGPHPITGRYRAGAPGRRPRVRRAARQRTSLVSNDGCSRCGHAQTICRPVFGSPFFFPSFFFGLGEAHNATTNRQTLTMCAERQTGRPAATRAVATKHAHGLVKKIKGVGKIRSNRRITGD